MARLASSLWVAAYMRRLEGLFVPAYLVQRGAAEAGAIIVKLNTLSGEVRLYHRVFELGAGSYHWAVLFTGDEAEADALLARARARDPDLWIIEVENPTGAAHLEDMG